MIKNEDTPFSLGEFQFFWKEQELWENWDSATGRRSGADVIGNDDIIL